MKKLAKPIQGKSLPIFYSGTLEEKYEELIRVQEKIEKILKNKDTIPSERLLDERGELELEISRHLCNGENINDVFMNYCLRHFNGSTTYMLNSRLVRNPSVFDIIPRVREFMDEIEKSKRKRITSRYGDKINETGIIDDACEIEYEHNPFMSLYVPVTQFFVINNKKFEKGRSRYDPDKGEKVIENRLFFVTPEIFSNPGLNFNIGEGRSWTTNRQSLIYLGGTGKPEETTIQIGDYYLSKAEKKQLETLE